MSPLKKLQSDYETIEKILNERRQTTPDFSKLGLGAEVALKLWDIYLDILKDALRTLSSLIEYLKRGR